MQTAPFKSDIRSSGAVRRGARSSRTLPPLAFLRREIHSVSAHRAPPLFLKDIIAGFPPRRNNVSAYKHLS